MIALGLASAWLLLVLGMLRRLLQASRAHNAGALAAVACPADSPDVAVIVPARDEVQNIGPCLAAIADQRYPRDRLLILALDDNSGDGTAAEIARRAAAEPRLRLLRTGTLPPGWLGKPHACAIGAAAAGAAEYLCFVDADVRVGPHVLAAAVAAAEAGGIAMLSLHPRQELGSLAERLIMPAGMLMIACAKGKGTRDERAVNGQFLLVRAAAYHAVGGHAAVRGAVCEDTALARRLARAGHPVRVLAADRLARTRMYRDLASLWEGFARNAVEILGSPRRTAAVCLAGALVGWCVPLLPVCLAWLAWQEPRAVRVVAFCLALAASAIVFAVHAATLRHFRAPPWLATLLPAALTAAALLGCYSAWLRRRGVVRWKGRRYRVPAQLQPRTR